MTQATVSIDLIDANPWQPRGQETEEHIANLAVSIADDGLMQIPSARQAGERYQLAFGHSRLAAFRLLANMQLGMANQEARTYEPDSPMARAWHAASIALENGTDFTAMPLNLMEIDDETMFRFAVSENVQRKDLNAIETAQAMLRYKNEFSRSSKDIGTLFGVNDATVRGTLRLLDLPEEARGLLASGEISQGVARSLLSTRNIWSEEKIDAAAKQIAASDGKANPNDVISSFMGYDHDDSNTIYGMWRDGAEGKPRAGQSYNKTAYWLLDMQNFPNALLPELTLSEIPDALGKQQDTLLLRYLAHSENALDLSFKLAHLDDQTAKGFAEKIEILIDPPACNSCPLYAKVNGTHYCGMRACHKRKQIAWQRDRIMQASRNLSIPVYAETDGAFLKLESSNNSRHEKMFEELNPDLRLIDKSALRGYPYQRFKGVDSDYIFVVMVGKTLLAEKEVLRQERAATKKGLNVNNNRWQLENDLKERLMWAAADEFATLLRGLNAAAIGALMDGTYGWYTTPPAWEKLADDAPAEEKADFLRRKVALNMISRMPIMLKAGYGASLIKRAELLETVALELGFELPNNIIRLAKEFTLSLDAEYPAAPVSVETPA